MYILPIIYYFICFSIFPFLLISCRHLYKRKKKKKKLWGISFKIFKLDDNFSSSFYRIVNTYCCISSAYCLYYNVCFVIRTFEYSKFENSMFNIIKITFDFLRFACHIFYKLKLSHETCFEKLFNHKIEIKISLEISVPSFHFVKWMDKRNWMKVGWKKFFLQIKLKQFIKWLNENRKSERKDF